ncbi:hypothetical protein [uncultured Endozoicomonas sp.]|uniref:hypothetical protein n=1 Tax=uncultured Endozoicomonas sp. TaxID=432652 RepID=UPI0026296175|nr:hypothetical protein [uncultured Endozoicomonas sp.]
MKRTIIPLLSIVLSLGLLAGCSSSEPEPPVVDIAPEDYPEIVEDLNQVAAMVADLDALYKAGITIRQQYPTDISNDQVQTCVAENGHYREQGQQLMDQARVLKTFQYRLPLTMAADAAFACVLCGGSGTTCDDIPKELAPVKVSLKGA